MTVSDSPPWLPSTQEEYASAVSMKLPCGRDVRVQDGEGLVLVRRPAEDVAAEGEGEDLEVGGAEGVRAEVM